MQENNIAPIANSPQTTVATAVDHKLSINSFLVILLSVLLFVSVSIAGFFAYQTQKLVKELQVMGNESKQKVSVTSEPTAGPTSNWKTFTDEKNRFSFRYPIDVEIKNENGRLSMILSDLDYPVSIIPDGPHNWGEGMTKDQLDKIYMKQFQYPDDPSRKMYPDTDVQFVIEFLTLDDKNKALIKLKRIDQILSTFKFTNSDQSIPKSISSLFDSVNNNFKLSLVPAEENQFYSPSGMITKKSWKIDLINANLGKSFVTFLNSQLTPNYTESGGIGGGGVDAYENDYIKCFHSYMYQGPEIHDGLSCAEK